MNNSINEFFAASNGYDGFTSYFNSVFDTEKYEKIYILKGGPGTGKSSFMRELRRKYGEKHLRVESVYCSSDPNSLDGVIIGENEKKIAVLDGTAPHAFEPILPGAAQKIINLGSSWNETLLQNNIEKLKELNNLKSYHYKSAYQFLSIAKRCVEIAEDEVERLLKYPYNSLYEIIDSIKSGNGKEDIRLTSAFCKQGFFELCGLGKNAKREINIVGIYGSEYILMNKIYAEAKRRSLDITISPSPLDKSKIDAILFNADNTVISVERKSYTQSPTLIDTSRYINTKELDKVKAKLETVYKEREVMLWCATDEFKKASDAHFEMEKIYTAAMNFTKNKKILKTVCDEINKIFDITNSITD